MIKAVFQSLCPSCAGPISSYRLSLGVPCNSCLPSSKLDNMEDISKYPLEKKIRLISKSLSDNPQSAYHLMRDTFEELESFEKLFRESTGKNIWSLQKTWAHRLLLGESFAITAPTGVGKTTLLLHYAAYQLKKGEKVYILVPTESLLNQTEEKLKEICYKMGIDAEIVVYQSRASKKKREEVLKKIEEGKFGVLITTTSFLSRRYDILKKLKFDLIVVDDADSLLKNSVNIEKVLVLIGFDEDDVKIAERLIKCRNELFFYLGTNNKEKTENLKKGCEELEVSLEEAKAKKKIGQLAVASATGRQAGSKPKLFKELLGFEIGGIHDYMRNIIDSFYLYKEDKELIEKIKEIVNNLGSGGLIFVSKDLGVNRAKELVKELEDEGIKTSLATAGKSVIKKLARGEVQVLVGVSSYYGVIVRGIDLPEVIKYAIFVGVPKNKMPLNSALFSPRRLLQALIYISDKDENIKARFEDLQSKINKLNPGEQFALRIALQKGTTKQLSGWLGEVADVILKTISEVTIKLDSIIPREKGAVLNLGTSLIERGEDGSLYYINPDPLTYIQASGRTSRFLNDKMTLGFCLIFEKSKEYLEVFKKKIGNYVYSFDPKELSSINLKEISERLILSRMGKDGSKSFKPAKSIMFVVESPHKAKTIAGFFGRPAKRRFGSVVVYEIPIVDQETLETYLAMIVATKGHLFDLVSDNNIGTYGVIKVNEEFIPVYAPISKCLSCGRTFVSLHNKCPYCGESFKIKSSMETVHVLRKIAMESEEIYIATDPDVEGEKIAWDVEMAIKPYNSKIIRAEFHEVTREAILEAIRNPRKIDESQVSSQILRRVTDRWIGFPLSSRLWSEFQKPWLGAGRVQTPTLGWIISRHEEWKNARGYWVRIPLINLFAVKLFKKDKKEAEDLKNAIIKSGSLKIDSYEIYEQQLLPPPPYTTDELLHDANMVYGYGAQFTMKLSQDLFEAGLITYHRTDSTHVSNKGIQIASEYLSKGIGKPEIFYPRSWGSEGTHEAIRPTKALSASDLKKSIVDGTLKTYINVTEAHIKLYDLIFRRFIASQSRPSVVEKLKLNLSISYNREKEVFEKELILREKETGFYGLLYNINEQTQIADYIKEGRIPVDVSKVEIYRGSLIPLYTQGEIVKLMKEKKIGRPSTYAKILDSLRRHGYVVISKKRNFVIPTNTGIKVYQYLSSNYSSLVSEETTRKLEEDMDAIEEGKESYLALLAKLYDALTRLGLISEVELAAETPVKIMDEALI
ncbi:reverse gyrase [Fervidicoccus fontis]|nr:reverse gyrase [Fervidicoccus fontis]